MRMETALVVALLVVGAAGAQTYNLHFKTFPDRGKSFEVKVADRMEIDYKAVGADGQQAGHQKTTTTIVEDFRQTTLEAMAGRLEKFRRHYTRAAATQGRSSRGLAMAGETITFTVGPKGGCQTGLKIKLSDAERGRLADADRDGLEMVARLLPEDAVPEGGRWKVTGKQVAEALRALPVDTEKSGGIGRLVSVKKRGGKTVGTLLMQVEFTTRQSKGSGSLEVRAEAPIDGSGTEAKVTVRSTIKMEPSAGEGKKKLAVHILAKGELEATISEEK